MYRSNKIFKMSKWTALFLLPILIVVLSHSTAAASSKIPEMADMVQTARDKGRVRVIVKLDVDNLSALMADSNQFSVLQPGQAYDFMATSADAALSDAVNRKANDVIAQLPDTDYEVTNRYSSIPFVALSVTENGLKALEAMPEVLGVEIDKPIPLPEPIKIGETYDFGAPQLNGTIPLIGANTAWSTGFTGSGYYVAILDTGIRSTHETFSGKTIVEQCYGTNDGANDSTSACPGGATSASGAGSAAHPPSTYSGYDHGTHVAGIAAGNSGTYTGVAKDASIIAVQVFSKFDSSAYCGGGNCVLTWTSDQVKGLDYVYSQRLTYSIASVNMSLGGGSYFAYCDSDSRKASIDNLAAANIAVAIATGNNGYCGTIGAPSCISTAVSVGASDDSDNMASFSNYNSSMVDLLAPGVAIMSSVPTSDTAYQSWNGTSMATPHVAGAFAVLKQKRPDLGVSNWESALSSTAKAVNVAASCSGEPSVNKRIQLDLAVNSLNRTPLADAGSNQSIVEGNLVTLNGSASADPDANDSLTYSWSEPAGVTLSSTTAASPTFTAPNVGAGGQVFNFTLTVKDNHNASHSDTVSVTVNDSAPANTPPTAEAGPHQNVNEGTLVTLDGTGSSDPDDGINSYSWSQSAGTTVTLNTPGASTTTFTAPQVGPAGETLTFDLTVQDVATQSDTDSVTITVNNVNQGPTANAGTDQSVDEGTTVTLNGSGSSDPDGDTLVYTWTQTAGTPSVTLSNNNSSQPTFVGYLADGITSATLTFQLKVEDPSGSSHTDTVNVTLNDNSVAGYPNDVIKTTTPGGATIGLKSNAGGDVVQLQIVDDTTLPSTGRPASMPYDLLDFRVKVTTPGSTVSVVVYLPAPAPVDAKWWKYSAGTGWYDYSANVVFNGARDQVTVTLTDGGAGDQDGISNGIIVDPSGLGTAASGSTPSSSSGGGGGGGGGCFVSTLMD